MSFIGGLFSTPKASPTPVAPPPKIGDAAGEAMVREERVRLKKKYGTDDTMLTGDLGSSGQGSAMAAAPPSRTMLG